MRTKYLALCGWLVVALLAGATTSVAQANPPDKAAPTLEFRTQAQVPDVAHPKDGASERRREGVADRARAALGADYAGAYIADDGVLVLKATRGRTVDGLDTEGVTIRVEGARFSKATLSAAAGVAGAMTKKGDRVGFYMESEKDNQVLVGLEPAVDTDATRAEVLASLASASKAPADVFRFVKFLGGGEESAIAGGHSISGGGFVCSMGAWGFAWYGSLRVPHLVTAGHCPNSVRHQGNHGPTYNTGAEWNGTNVDAQRMAPASGLGEWTTAVAGGFTITNVVNAGGAFDTAGHQVCKSGQSTGVTCGALWSNNSGCREHTGMRIAAYTSAGGDSGGTVFSGTFPGVALAGFHEGLCTVDLGNGPFDLRMYTFQANAAWILGIQGWYTS